MRWRECFPSQAGHESAVRVVGKGEQLALALEPEAGMLDQELGDGVLVFFGFEAAGAIDEAATGPQEGGALAEQLQLGGAQVLETFGSKPPAQIDPPPHNAGIRAGDIDQDAITKGWGLGIEGRDTGDAEAGAVFPDEFEAVRGGVVREELALVGHELGQAA